MLKTSVLKTPVLKHNDVLKIVMFKNHWCFKNNNGLIHCMNGDTFSSEKKHGTLKIGDVVDGYALVAQISTCNTFAVHKPINKRIYYPRPLNRRKACVR